MYLFMVQPLTKEKTLEEIEECASILVKGAVLWMPNLNGILAIPVSYQYWLFSVEE